MSTTAGVTEATIEGPAFEDRGAAEPALLYIPGWCGDRTVFDDLMSRTAPNRRSLSMDLPQHGTRPRTGSDFGTADVVDDAVALLEERGVDRVLPVALSHAGWAAIELRRRLGAARVPGIVLLDWMVLGTPPGFVDALAGLQHPTAWADVRAGLFSMWTTGLDVPALQEYVSTMGSYDAPYWQRAGREISRAFTTEGTPLDALDRLSEPCPTLHVYAQPGDEDFLVAQQHYATTHPWFRVRRLNAQSHFPMFEVPDELSDSIEEFACDLP